VLKIINKRNILYTYAEYDGSRKIPGIHAETSVDKNRKTGYNNLEPWVKWFTERYLYTAKNARRRESSHG